MPFFGPRGMPLCDPHALLNLERGATDEDVARSFKRLMLRLHPDKQPAGQAAAEAADVARRLHDVMDARNFLLDEEHRAARLEYAREREAREAAERATARRRPRPPASSRSTGSYDASTDTGGGSATRPRRAGGTTTSQKSGEAVPTSRRAGRTARAEATDERAAGSAGAKGNLNVKQWGATRRSARRPAGREDNSKNKLRRQFSGQGGHRTGAAAAASGREEERKPTHAHSHDPGHGRAARSSGDRAAAAARRGGAAPDRPTASRAAGGSQSGGLGRERGPSGRRPPPPAAGTRRRTRCTARRLGTPRRAPR